ncbi:TPA: hypothetical protein N0F65_000544 [Lagenidium giganteum]|uniref:Uncharacterized protein n=1 Tax=Lagenidium giganteum TaxID=4803 RepID=A0AAV2Z4S0_9STRA|nr:TPA: hypothetical protein N0F65_000544 [Lagenidium giganteum]
MGPAEAARVVPVDAVDRVQQQKKKRRRKISQVVTQTVIKQRSKLFNLTLDVQTLKNEIQNLTVLRDILRQKALSVNYVPSGSLMQVVREFYRLFRTGYHLNAVHGRRCKIREEEQTGFLHSVVDESVDLSNGLFGVDIMVEQLKRYAVFVRFLELDMKTFKITAAQETVVISTAGTFRMKILRTTIETIFPHVLSREDLVAKLVGMEATAPVRLLFCFHGTDKIARYDVDVGFLDMFSRVLADPRDVELLLGQAFIGKNAMFVTETTAEGALPAACAAQKPHRAAAQTDQSHEQRQDSVPSGPVMRLQRVLIDQFFRSFHLTSSPTTSERNAQQLHFFQTALDGLRFQYNGENGWQSLARQWDLLSSRFLVRSFRQTSDPQDLEQQASSSAQLTRVAVQAEYELEIDSFTLVRVFPHVDPASDVAQQLQSHVIGCTAGLVFSFSADSSVICALDETIHFHQAVLHALDFDLDQTHFVLGEAAISSQGMMIDTSVAQQPKTRTANCGRSINDLLN